MHNRFMSIAAGAAALAFTVSATQAAIVTVDIHPPTASQISDDPTLADATIIDLIIDSESDLLLSFDLNLATSGTIYNHTFEEADDAPPSPAVVSSFPSAGADSHVAFGEPLGGNLSSPDGSFPLSVAGPLAPVAHNGLVARITVLNDESPSIDGTAYFSADGTTSFDVAFTAALDGDLNLDGFVGVDDLNIVLVNWNQNVTNGSLSMGDPTGDGFVGVDDLNIVLVNWNNGTPPAGAAVPEPASLAMLGLGAAAMLRRR